MSEKTCPNCGSPISEDAKFCPNCGSTIGAAPVTPAQQNTGYAPPPVNPQYQQGYYQPDLYAPMTIGQYILTYIVFCIPIVGIIMMFVWGFGSNVNINKKNLCRAALILAAIGVVLSIIFSSVLVSLIASIFSGAGYSYYGY